MIRPRTSAPNTDPRTIANVWSLLLCVGDAPRVDAAALVPVGEAAELPVEPEGEAADAAVERLLEPELDVAVELDELEEELPFAELADFELALALASLTSESQILVTSV